MLTDHTSKLLAAAIQRVSEGLADGSIQSRLCAGCGAFQRKGVPCLAERMCRQIYRESRLCTCGEVRHDGPCVVVLRENRK